MTITVELKLLEDMAGGRCRVIGFTFVMGVHGRLQWQDRDRRGLMATTSPQAVRPGRPSLSRGPRWQSPADLLRAVKAGETGSPRAWSRVVAGRRRKSLGRHHCPAGPFVGRSPSRRPRRGPLPNGEGFLYAATEHEPPPASHPGYAAK